MPAGSSPHCQTFLGYGDELSINSRILLKGTRVCIPLELLNCTLADLHGAHQGINRMQAQAREAVYWPSIDADIADYVCQCNIFTKHKASPPAQPMLPRHVPDGSWKEIAADYFTHKGKEYLLICNQFSKCTRSPPSQPSLSMCMLAWAHLRVWPTVPVLYRQWEALCICGACTLPTMPPHRTLHLIPILPPGLMGSLNTMSEP